MNLRSMIRATISETDLDDPHEIAVQVLDDMTLEDQREALQIVLPVFVARVLGDLRYRVSAMPYEDESEPETTTSRRVTRLREKRVAQLLDSRYHALEQWKKIGACDVKDCIHIRDELVRQSHAMFQKSKMFDRLIAELEADETAIVVSDLPDDAILEALEV